MSHRPRVERLLRVVPTTRSWGKHHATRWRGPTFVDGPGGQVRPPDDDNDIMILETPRSPRLDLDGPIVCDWRPGDVWQARRRRAVHGDGCGLVWVSAISVRAKARRVYTVPEGRCAWAPRQDT